MPPTQPRHDDIIIRRRFGEHPSTHTVKQIYAVTYPGHTDEGAEREHYREADPMKLKISATQWLIHGAADDSVPPFLSRNYTEQKKQQGENVHYLEISTASHSDLIDPRSAAWPKVEGTILHLVAT